MAETNKTPQWKVQEDLRAQRRAKRKAPSKAQDARSPLAPADTTLRTLRLVLVDDTQQGRRRAYDALKDETVRAYFRKFSYHEARQEAAMKGEVLFRQVPFVLFRTLQRALTGEGKPWKMGKLEVR